MEHDPSHVYGENNNFRYVPIKSVLVRTKGMSDDDIAILLLGTKLCGVTLDLSMEQGRTWLQRMNGYYDSLIVETEAELILRIKKEVKDGQVLRGNGISETLSNTAILCGMKVLDRSVLANGRLELLGYLQEQTVSETMHRYGNLIPAPEN